MDILNELLSLYNRQSVSDKNKLAANTIAFIDERIKTAEAEVAAVENKIQKYKKSKGIVDLSEQGSLFLNKVATNDQQISNIDVQLAAL